MKDKMKLKVCGMREPGNMLQVALLQPDYMGFIFYPKSPRYVGETFEIPADFPTQIKRVGVFVNASTEEMIRLTNRYALDYLQLHGEESTAQVQELKNADLKVIKVFSVSDAFDFSVTRPYESLVDFFLFDTKGMYYGGNARAFDWAILKQYDQHVPFFLSGGIAPENVAAVRLLETMNLHALDVNSGVEEEPGIKNPDKIKAIQNYIN